MKDFIDRKLLAFLVMLRSRKILRDSLTLLGSIALLALFPAQVWGQTHLLTWGTNGSGNGEFQFPQHLAADASGNVYVGDSDNHRVQKFDSSGNYLTQWGINGSGDGQFTGPYGVAVDASGNNVYVVDRVNQRVQKFDSNGTFITKWGTNGTGDGQFNTPAGLTVDASGNVYVVDTNNHRIQKFDSNGTFITKWGTFGTNDGQFDTPTGIVVDAGGNVYVADHRNDRVQVFDSNGTFITKWGTNGTGDGQFDLPSDLVVDAAGNVYVTDLLNHRVQVFDNTGTFITKWGTFGTNDGQFNSPNGIAVSGGAVYVLEISNHRVQKFTTLVSDVTVSVPTVTATYNQALTIPVSISEASGIIAAEVTVEYDTNLLTLVTPPPAGVTSTGTLTDGWSVEYNTEPGAGSLEKVKIAVATDVNAVTGAATLVDIQFTVNDVRVPASSALTLSDVLLNDGDPTNTTVDGSVTLVGNDATIVFSSGGSPIPREPITAVVTDADADLTSGPGNDNVSVTITNLGNGDVINASFPEDATTAGTFSLVVPSEFGLSAIADAIIQAQAGDDVDFSYVDQLDANGNGPITRAIQANFIGGTDGTAAITQVTQPGDIIYLKVVDADLNTNPAAAETAQIVVTSSNGESETVTLNEVDVDDDVFFGSLNSTAGATAGTNDDGTINAQKGDVLTATYDDVVTAVGSQVDRTATDQVIDPFGDADGNGQIQAFDAAQVLQHILVPPLVTLTGLELLAADVADAFGILSPFDAAKILQKVVGLITTFPVQEAASLNHPQAVPSSSPKKAVETRSLVLAYVDGYLSVQADERSDIISGDVLIVGVKGQVQLGAELDDFIVASRQTDEGLRILFAGALPVDGPGELLRVYSGVGPNKAQLSRARFNDGTIIAVTPQTALGTVRPVGFALHANWPNPFNPETTIAFDLPQAGGVELQIFDVLGQSVRTLVAESLPAGHHQVVWNGLDEAGAKVSSGVYVYRLQAGAQVHLRRMLLLK